MHTNQVQPPMKVDRKPNPFEQYVVASDTAKRLRDDGWSHRCLFSWWVNPYAATTPTVHLSSEEYFGDPGGKIPAPMAAELKPYYPAECWITVQKNLRRCKGLFHFSLFGGKHIVSLMVRGSESDNIYEFHREEDANEADAVGRMLIYIYENKMRVTGQ